MLTPQYREPPPQASTAMERITARLMDNGYMVQQRGNWARAQCPAHEDRNPSLSITNQPGKQRARVHCFAGCDHKDILAALGWTIADLYDEPRAPRSAGSPLRVSVPRPEPQTPVQRAVARLLASQYLGEVLARCAKVQADREADPAYWLALAEEFEAAAFKPGDFTGNLTPEQIANQRANMQVLAQACRNKAAFLRTVREIWPETETAA